MSFEGKYLTKNGWKRCSYKPYSLSDKYIEIKFLDTNQKEIIPVNSYRFLTSDNTDKTPIFEDWRQTVRKGDVVEYNDRSASPNSNWVKACVQYVSYYPVPYCCIIYKMPILFENHKNIHLDSVDLAKNGTFTHPEERHNFIGIFNGKFDHVVTLDNTNWYRYNDTLAIDFSNYYCSLKRELEPVTLDRIRSKFDTEAPGYDVLQMCILWFVFNPDCQSCFITTTAKECKDFMPNPEWKIPKSANIYLLPRGSDAIANIKAKNATWAKFYINDYINEYIDLVRNDSGEFTVPGLTSDSPLFSIMTIHGTYVVTDGDQVTYDYICIGIDPRSEISRAGTRVNFIDNRAIIYDHFFPNTIVDRSSLKAITDDDNSKKTLMSRLISS